MAKEASIDRERLAEFQENISTCMEYLFSEYEEWLPQDTHNFIKSLYWQYVKRGELSFAQETWAASFVWQISDKSLTDPITGARISSQGR